MTRKDAFLNEDSEPSRYGQIDGLVNLSALTTRRVAVVGQGVVGRILARARFGQAAGGRARQWPRGGAGQGKP